MAASTTPTTSTNTNEMGPPPFRFSLRALFMFIAAVVPVCAAIPYGMGPAVIVAILMAGIGVVGFGVVQRNIKNVLAGIVYILIAISLISGGGRSEYLGRILTDVRILVVDRENGMPLVGADVHIDVLDLPSLSVDGVTGPDGAAILTRRFKRIECQALGCGKGISNVAFEI